MTSTRRYRPGTASSPTGSLQKTCVPVANHWLADASPMPFCQGPYSYSGVRQWSRETCAEYILQRMTHVQKYSGCPEMRVFDCWWIVDHPCCHLDHVNMYRTTIPRRKLQSSTEWSHAVSQSLPLSNKPTDTTESNVCEVN